VSSWFCHLLFHQVCYGFLFHLMAMKNSIFWDMTQGSLVNVTGCFSGTCCLHVKDWRVSQPSNSVCCLFLAWLSLLPSSWKLYIPWKHQLTFTGPHSNMCQKTALIRSVIVITLDFRHIIPFYALLSMYVTLWDCLWFVVKCSFLFYLYHHHHPPVFCLVKVTFCSLCRMVCLSLLMGL
jgi:hypothetical protein